MSTQFKNRMSELDILYNKLNVIKFNYEIGKLSYREYITEKLKIENKIFKIFNP